MADWLGTDAASGDVISIAGVAYVLYDAEGRTGGSLSWCDCNPGNIVTSQEAEKYGAFAGTHNYRFAVFPDETTGQSAVVSYLSNPVRSGKSILDMMKAYAPAGDGPNSPEAYAAAIASALGVGTDTIVNTLSDTQLSTMAGIIQQKEGWEPGTPFSPDDVPAELSDWLGAHSECTDREQSDQPYADVLAPPSPGIANLQQFLNQAGADPQLATDGAFGPMTKAAAVAFQQQQGLTADGIVGPGTWQALLAVVGGNEGDSNHE